MAVKSNVNYSMKSTIAPECIICRGRCYVKGDQVKTQENASKMFNGKKPNSCIDAEGGFPECPAERGLI